MTPGTLAGMRLTLPATLMETDGDAVPLTFTLVAVPPEPVRVTVTDATGHVTLAVRTLDDRRVEPTATFRVTLPDDSVFDLVKEMAEERVEMWRSAGVLRTGDETDATLGLSPE